MELTDTQTEMELSDFVISIFRQYIELNKEFSSDKVLNTEHNINNFVRDFLILTENRIRQQIELNGINNI